jgi:hypothetical protein
MSVVSFCAVDARLLRLENTDLKRELADARQALALQRQRTAEAERQIAALRDVQARAWRVSLMYFRPTAEALPNVVSIATAAAQALQPPLQALR